MNDLFTHIVPADSIQPKSYNRNWNRLIHLNYIKLIINITYNSWTK